MRQRLIKFRDIFLTGPGSRAEHYEIAAHTGIVTMARAMGEIKAVAGGRQDRRTRYRWRPGLINVVF